MPGVLVRREIWTKTQDRKRPCEDTGRRCLPFNKSKRERPQNKPVLPTHWFLISGLQDCEKINFCCLSSPVCGTCYGGSSKLTQHCNHLLLKFLNIITATRSKSSPYCDSAWTENALLCLISMMTGLCKTEWFCNSFREYKFQDTEI